ncbi:MAG: peptide-methionine (S)-S-oxide reductase MsrA [Burkholderiaceae bacterium]|nr:peptide-methionine (S)-S-oxide reductase MsrA [Aquabacterium sp.]NUP85528.1 peptide-methionine (S)-S-oxide reductase MsrA [Burkholderiaceae bacterium]
MGPQQLITLAGGCFWCLEAVYEQVEGVLAVESGYSNGHVAAPTYEQVCSGATGHAEVVRVRFDPDQIALTEILEIFFAIHDPTTLNRQGHDVGTQYRSAIFTHDDEQDTVARDVLQQVQLALQGRAVTEVAREAGYTRAEDYHQHYYARHPGQGYCANVIEPKLDKFRRTFSRARRR